MVDEIRSKRWAVGCYIPIFNIVVCVLASVRMANDEFTVFHARQGLVLFMLWFLTIVSSLISQTLSLMLWGVVLLLHISGFVLVLQMKQAQIPIIGQIAMKIPPLYLFKLLTGKTSVDDEEL